VLCCLNLLLVRMLFLTACGQGQPTKSQPRAAGSLPSTTASITVPPPVGTASAVVPAPQATQPVISVVPPLNTATAALQATAVAQRTATAQAYVTALQQSVFASATALGLCCNNLATLGEGMRMSDGYQF